MTTNKQIAAWTLKVMILESCTDHMLEKYCPFNTRSDRIGNCECNYPVMKTEFQKYLDEHNYNSEQC
jgi:hypothetical protein